MVYEGKDRRVEWYDNKELYEKMMELKSELGETQKALKEYNGLRQRVEEVDDKVKVVSDKLGDVCRAVDTMVAEGVGKNKLVNGAVIMIGVVGTLMGIAGGVLALASSRGM